MRKYLKFFNKRVIVNSAKEAEQFINGLTDMNEPDGRPLVVNDNTRRQLDAIFRDENGGRKLQTTGCSSGCCIYCYPAWGETLDECEQKAIEWVNRERTERELEVIREHQERSREINERRKELSALPRGRYEVTIGFTLMDARGGAFRHRDYTYTGIAENGEDAFRQVLSALREKYGDCLVAFDSIVDADIALVSVM